MNSESARVMYAFFLIHAYLEKHCGELAMQVFLLIGDVKVDISHYVPMYSRLL